MSQHNTLLIGLTGLAGSGKDTCADYLADAFAARGHKVTRLAFADTIKSMLQVLGVPNHFITDRAHKEQPIPPIGVSYRQLAQTLGTDWGRNMIHPDLWTIAASRRLKIRLGETMQRPGIALFTDVRFANEAAMVTTGLNGLRGAVVRVVRPDVAKVRSHASEEQMLLADHTIDNSFDLLALRAKCNQLADMLMIEAQLEAA